MNKTVLFRDFEDRDIEYIYKWKNDKKLNSHVVGGFRPFSYEDAVKWVHGCMGEHDTYKFWAICTNDEEKKIIGWVSLSEIDYINKRACYHGIVIADNEFKNGFAWIESYLFIYEYVFEHLGFLSIYGRARNDHSSTQIIRKVMFHQEIEDGKEIVFINGKSVEITASELQSRDYFAHKQNGDYELPAILKRMRIIMRENKK